MKLPVELRSPRKELINLKNNDQNCFLWCHVRHINHLKNIQKELEKLIKNLLKIEKNNNICINIFCYKDGLVFPKYISDQKFKNSMDLLFLTDCDKSHYVYIKGFVRFVSQNKE